MSVAEIRGLSLALSLGALFSLVGCASQDVTVPAAPPSDNPLPVAATDTEKSAGGTTRHAIAYPTGNRATSTVLLERLSPADVLADIKFQYEIRVTNLADLELTDVVVSDRIPQTLMINDSEPGLLSRTGGQAQWALGVIAPRGERTIRVTATSSQTGPLKADSSVSYSLLLSSTINVIHPDLSLTLDMPSEVLIGDTFPLTVAVANNGVGAAQNIQVTYVPPEAFSIVEGTPSWKLATLEPGTPRGLSGLTLRADRPGRHTHQTSAVAEMTNGTISAQSPSVSIDVLQPELAIKIDGPEEYLFDVNLAGQRLHPANENAKTLMQSLRDGDLSPK